MRAIVSAFLVATAVSVSLASQPGQHLDCSDWVILVPELHCAQPVPDCSVAIGTPPGDGSACVVSNDHRTLTNDGRTLRVAQVRSLGCTGEDGSRLELREYVDGQMRLLAYINFRCNDVSSNWWNNVESYLPILDPSDGAYSTRIRFDPIRGAASISVQLNEYCSVAIGGCDPSNTRHVQSIFEFRGFTTLFDVMQSYTPEHSALAFTVPIRPEAFRAADHFDTYWGDVTQPLDLANAHPLQCAYPNAPPHAGDFLSFPDAAPVPQPGRAIYYLTSVTYQGQMRAGRKASGGKLSGRDASKLPACAAP